MLNPRSQICPLLFLSAQLADNNTAQPPDNNTAQERTLTRLRRFAYGDCKDQTASGGCTRSQSDELSHWGRMQTLLPAGSNRSERLEKSTRLRQEGRQNWPCSLGGLAVRAFTLSASPIQLYFGVPNPAIGIAASARELLQNLQRL